MGYRIHKSDYTNNFYISKDGLLFAGFDGNGNQRWDINNTAQPFETLLIAQTQILLLK